MEVAGLLKLHKRRFDAPAPTCFEFTNYAIESKKYKTDWQPTLFETSNPLFDTDKTRVKGKIFTLTHDTNSNGKIDIDDLEWHYYGG